MRGPVWCCGPSRAPMAAGPAADPRVLSLAARVSEGSERDVPGLLLKLKGNLFRL